MLIRIKSVIIEARREKEKYEQAGTWGGFMAKNKDKETQKKETPKRMGKENWIRTDRLYGDMRLFEDTVFFEYSYSDEGIYLSPNAGENIDGSVLEDIFAEYKENPPGEGNVQSFEFQMGKAGEPYCWCGCKLIAEWSKEGDSPVRLIGKLQDISGLKAREEQILLQSAKDGLTGVLNKTAFQYRVEERLKEGKAGWLCMLDIDNFKEINDRFGHLAGDEILMELGKLLCSMYPEPELVGRVGGDEFVIYTQQENIRTQAELLLKNIRKLSPDKNCRLSVSIGVVGGQTGNHSNYQTLFRNVDEAMYSAKEAGKNRIAFRLSSESSIG